MSCVYAGGGGRGGSNVMLHKIKLSMNVINVGMFFVHCWTCWVSNCNCTNLLPDVLHHHSSGDYKFVWSDSTISFFSITVWLHYWSLFYITIICKSARTILGKVSWYSSLGSPKRTRTHFKPTNAWGNKGQHQNSDCSNYVCTAMHRVYKQ